MVELWFGGSVGLWFNSWDVRSVIKNATKDPKMSESKDKTILNKDEIDAKKVAQTTKPKVQPSVWSQIWWIPGVGSISISKPQKTTQSTTPTKQVWGNIWTNIGWIPWVWDISGIKVANVGGTQNVWWVSNDKRLINGRGRMTALKDVVDVDSAIEDLYMDVGVWFRNWTLADTDVNTIKQAYSEFAWLDDNVIMDLIADLWSLYQKWLSLNETNLAKLKEWYPELKSVGRWFTTPEEQNIYQWWWFRETINQWTPTDLNKYGAAGKVAETVVNPLWQATTALDAAAQQIPQVTGAKMEKKLKDKLSSLSEEDINRYYDRYKELVSQWKLKWYTTRVEWKNTVAQMWNAIFGWKSGKKYQDVEWGFRQWLIDQVDADVNGFAGALFDTNYFDQEVWPNVWKMFANIPASAVKTVTAITRAMTNPLDTLSWLGTLIFTEEWHQALKARYGSWEAISKAIEQDPVWTASDILAVAEWGAGLVRWVSKVGRLWMKWASLATAAVWAENASKNLFKLAERLKWFEWKVWAFQWTVWWASDMWVRQLLYGIEKWWVMKWWLIPALEQWASEWNNLTNKAARYLAKTQQPMKTFWEEVTKTREAGWVSGRIAQKVTGSSSAEDKLFKAANPNINRLTRGIDYKNKKANMDISNKAIVESWYTPKNTAERVDAHNKTLTKKWNEFKQKVKWKANTEVSSDKLVKVLEDHIKEQGKNVTQNQKGDIKALQKEINALKGRKKFDMLDLEDYKENINADTKNKTQTAKSDIYIRWMKKLSQAIGDLQNELLSNTPDEVKNLKREIGALLDTKDDIIKANVKNLKAKEWGWPVESFSRIQWTADIVWWVVQTALRWEVSEGLWKAAKWVGKVVLWKALWKVKDVDWLTKQWFEWLSKKYGGEWINTKWLSWKTKWVWWEIKKQQSFTETEKARNYEDALNSAYRKGERKNKILSKSEQTKVKGEISKRAKNVWFVTKLFDNMVEAVRKSGWEAREGDIIHGFTDIRKKIIALSKNPLDTTMQHELFHAVFDAVDSGSKKMILDEATKFLEQKLGRAIDKAAAEEWLAESFWIYMKNKMVDLWVINRAKWIAWLKQRVETMFQRWYEWMQNYNTDRFLINDFFNAMREGKGLNKKWTMDLSYLWNNKWVDVKWVAKKWGTVKMQKGLVQRGNKLYVETPYWMRSAWIPENALSVKEYKEWFSSKWLQDKIKNIDKASVSKLLDNNDIAGAVKKINSSNGKKLFDLWDDNKLYMNTSYGPQVVSVSNTKQWVKNYLMWFMDQITDKKRRDQWLKFQKESYPGEKAINEYFKNPNNRIASNKEFAKRWMWTPDNWRFESEGGRAIKTSFNDTQSLRWRYGKNKWNEQFALKLLQDPKARKDVAWKIWNLFEREISRGSDLGKDMSQVIKILNGELDWKQISQQTTSGRGFMSADRQKLKEIMGKEYTYVGELMWWAKNMSDALKEHSDFMNKYWDLASSVNARRNLADKISDVFGGKENVYDNAWVNTSHYNTRKTIQQVVQLLNWEIDVKDLDDNLYGLDRSASTANKFEDILWKKIWSASELRSWIKDLYNNIDEWNKWLKYQKWYHGSKADFEKFSTKHIGEGEWNQAQWWWIYIAKNKETGLDYANTLWWYRYAGKWKGWLLHNMIANMLDDGMKFDDAIQKQKKSLQDSIETYKTQLQNNKKLTGSMRQSLKEHILSYQDDLEQLNKLKKEDFKISRNLYEVDIPDPIKKDTPTGKNYLYEDEKISVSAMKKIAKALKTQYAEIPNAAQFFEVGAEAKFDMTWKWMYRRLASLLWSDEKASKFLESLWYDWIQYRGSRGDNFVIFNDDSIKIENHVRFQKDNTGRELSKGQQEYFKDSKIVDKNGRLMVMYHWTNADDFNIFDKGKIKSQNYWKGFYFTSDLNDAGHYGKSVKKVYLDVKNPLDLATKEGEKEYNKWYGKKNSPYDWYVYNFSDGSKMVVVKDSSQIKNIDNLNPTKSIDIRYQKNNWKWLTPKKKTSKTTSNKYLKWLALRWWMRYKEEK